MPHHLQHPLSKDDIITAKDNVIAALELKGDTAKKNPKQDNDAKLRENFHKHKEKKKEENECQYLKNLRKIVSRHREKKK